MTAINLPEVVMIKVRHVGTLYEADYLSSDNKLLTGQSHLEFP